MKQEKVELNGSHNAAETTLEDDDDLENRLEDAGLIKPPDGGYGWVVVFASFMANVIVDGVIFSIGDVIVELWEKEFDTTTSMAAIAPSLLAGFYLLSGPLASALSNYFGCNYVAMGGSLIAASGFLLSALVPALPVLFVTFGVVGGIGFGLIFLPAIVIVGQYFSERRALATGIAVCGSGIGTMIMSKLNPHILRLVSGAPAYNISDTSVYNTSDASVYNTSGAPDIDVGVYNNWRLYLVVIAGITLLCIICGWFFKPLKPSSSQIDEVTKITAEYIEKQEKESENPLSVEAETTTSPHVAPGVAIERFKTNNAGELRKRLNPERPFLSTIELHASRRSENHLVSQKDLAAIITKDSLADLNRPLAKMDIFYPGSITSLNHRARAGSMLAAPSSRKQSTAENRSIMYLSTAGLPTADEDESWRYGITATLKMLLDKWLLTSPSFLVLAIGGFLTMSCFFVPFMFIRKLAEQNKVDGTNLVTLLGFINVIARVLCGYISDLPHVDPLLVTNVALILGGIATMAAPFLTAFWMFALYCTAFGFGVACFAALRSIVCVELLGLEKLSNAYGILLLFMGAAALVGPPFAGAIKNATDSYNMSFHVMGALMVLSGVIGLPLRRLNAWEKKRMMEESKHSVEMQPLNKDS
uniref:Major facilitator superfamily (MFS) profile domain-containing protein n=1 Tax=Acrobeloides nanus TaxID=290746 RepID=A0A914CBC6_9BILA